MMDLLTQWAEENLGPLMKLPFIPGFPLMKSQSYKCP
jgi:hypothetical protein